ncbi:hypothetical protein KEM48_009023 [Puccinia striiformis f. sp. tritici PST-130]|nr:hypothetical protein KEM48_009023 [Puccinia striiformis f. sp. tritici PST-130]
MYCRFFVAVVLILQTMASAAPSSSSEAGAHLRRRQAKPDPCIASPVLCRCEVNLPAHHENDGSTSRWRCFVAPSFLESATLLHFSHRHVAYFSLFRRKSCTLPACYLSIPKDGHTYFLPSGHLCIRYFHSETFERKKPPSRGVS